MKNTTELFQEKDKENYKQKARAFVFIWMGAATIALTLAIGAGFGHAQWEEAQISQRGRTVPAQIIGVERGTVQYTFALPSGQPMVDAVEASPQKVYETHIRWVSSHPPPGLDQGQRFNPATVPCFPPETVQRSPPETVQCFPPETVQCFPPETVRYVPGEPSLHRLQGFGYDSSAGSPLGAAVELGLFLCFGGVCLGKGLQLRQEALASAGSSGPTPPPGLTPGRAEPLAASGSLPALGLQPSFTYRQEGQCLFLTPDRYTVSQILRMVLGASLAVGFFGVFAYVGAFLLQSTLLAWHGIYIPGMTVDPHVGTPEIIRETVFGTVGAVLFLLVGAVVPAGIVWSVVTDHRSRTRPGVLDRGRGEFRIGARVVCGLGDIARLHVRRGHNPDAPKNLRNARYFGSFVLRDGRQVPFGRSVGEYTSGKEPEAELGDGIAGAKIEAVMQAVAAFLGVEYALTGGPDEGLRPRKGEGGM